MKFTTLVGLALSTTMALAVPVAELESRQAGCSAIYVFFARGTGETATLGTTVGPPLRAAIDAATTKTLGFEGIAYPAVIAGYLAGGDAGGAKTMATALATYAARCPSTKLFLSGYS